MRQLSLFPAVKIIPLGYMWNPYSETCIHKVNQAKRHSEAKAYCESLGEQLATIRTIETLQWLRDHYIEIGGM